MEGLFWERVENIGPHTEHTTKQHTVSHSPTRIRTHAHKSLSHTCVIISVIFSFSSLFLLIYLFFCLCFASNSAGVIENINAAGVRLISETNIQLNNWMAFLWVTWNMHSTYIQIRIVTLSLSLALRAFVSTYVRIRRIFNGECEEDGKHRA